MIGRIHRKSCVLSGRFHLCEESIHNRRFGLMAFPSRFLAGGTSLRARQKDALFDGLTGLGNRAIDKERLSQRVAGSQNPARAHTRPVPNRRQGGTPRRQGYWVTLEGVALRCQSAGTAACRLIGVSGRRHPRARTPRTRSPAQNSPVAIPLCPRWKLPAT